jgi:conjugative relaxase-like TrwC/TraI family protein
VLVLHPIQGGQARYYLDGRAPGWWIGSGAADLGLRDPVDERALPDLLAGHRPGGELLLSRVPHNRRSGFDLILAAPKSVSLLAALGDDRAATQFLGAHEQAVRSTLDYLQRNAALTRRGASHERIPTRGFVAAAFTHRQSGTGDPHLHTHVVVANLAQGSDERWSALDSRALYRHARAGGAVFQAALRYHLAGNGLRFGWSVNRQGLGDIVGVPRPAIEAASSRQRQVRAELAAAPAGPVARATAAGRTRGIAEPDVPGIWEKRVVAAGWDRDKAERLITDAARRHQLSPEIRLTPPDVATIARTVAADHSRFQRRDVVRAAAALARDGTAVAGLEAAADAFLQTALPAGAGHWTTVGLRGMEERIVAAVGVGDGRPARVGLIRPDTPFPTFLTDPARDAVARLTLGGAAVDRLGGTFLSQATVLSAARTLWEANGHRVAVMGRTALAEGRWRALAGLEPPPPAPGHATVVLVDGADRWSTPDLQRVVADATARRAKLVLIEGGSQRPRRQAESPAMEAVRRAVPAIDPGPPERAGDVAAVVAAGRDASVRLTLSAPAALAQITRDWSQLRAEGSPARMVALGPDEAEHLNARAREVLASRGELRGPVVSIGGRGFQAGDDVAALGRDARLGSVLGGSVGRVSAVDPEGRWAAIDWPGRPESVTVAAGPHPIPLTHGYATTATYLRGGHDGPLLSLGAVEAFASSVRPGRVYEVMPSPPPDRARDGHLATILAGVPAAIVDPSDVARPLAELAAARDRLVEQLMAPVPAGAARHDQLHRCDGLSQAIRWREAALGRGAEIRPTVAVESHLGAPPGEAERLVLWRRAATAIEAHRDRWALPDRPLALAPGEGRDAGMGLRAGEGRQGGDGGRAGEGRQAGEGRNADERRVLAAVRAFERAREVDRSLLPSGP